jgi:hypothetical protein
MAYVGSEKQIDNERLGGVLVMGAAIILAIRTARREPIYNPRESNRDWEAEIDFALGVSMQLLGRATSYHAELFRHKVVKYTDGIVAEDERL